MLREVAMHRLRVVKAEHRLSLGEQGKTAEGNARE